MDPKPGILAWIERLPNEAKFRVSESAKWVAEDSILHSSIVIPMRARLHNLTENGEIEF